MKLTRAYYSQAPAGTTINIVATGPSKSVIKKYEKKYAEHLRYIERIFGNKPRIELLQHNGWLERFTRTRHIPVEVSPDDPRLNPPQPKYETLVPTSVAIW